MLIRAFPRTNKLHTSSIKINFLQDDSCIIDMVDTRMHSSHEWPGETGCNFVNSNSMFSFLLVLRPSLLCNYNKQR